MSDRRRAIETIAASLAGMSASAEAGAAIDLAGLETAVGAALRQAEAAPPSERPSLLLALAALAVELDELAGAIQRQRRSDTRRAAAAYGNAIERSSGDR